MNMKMKMSALLMMWGCVALGAAEPRLTRLAFGSCAHQDRDQVIWGPINAFKPDAFLFLGDNIYGDTEDMDVMRAKYAKLAAQPGFAELRQKVPVYAVWDDHDYGVNDGGKEYPKRAESQQVFLDFFRVPENSPLRQRAGTYHSVIHGEAPHRVQLIMLDTRYFRDPLDKLPVRGQHGSYIPTKDRTRTMLGEAQWQWLEQTLREPAEIRIVMTSIQMLSTDHQWESWGTMPHEKERFIGLLRRTGANGVILLSGDRHRGEVSKQPAGSGQPYTLYEVTSSGLTMAGGGRKDEPNSNRVGTPILSRNFGTLEIDWAATPVHITLGLRDVEGKVWQEVKVSLDELQSRSNP